MRDWVLGPLILALATLGLVHPWVGILGWTWISIMNPHAYSWHLNSMPVAALLAGATLLGLVFTRDRRQWFITRETTVLILFVLWISLTVPFSFYLEESLRLWNRVLKIDLMVLAALLVLYSRKHIVALVWVLVLSLGVYGVKGGLFTLATGGGYRVWGPQGSYIEGNNELALALVMIIPLMRFLQRHTSSRWIARALMLAMLLCAVAALGSQSRGALLAIAAMGLVLWWRSERKLAGAVGLLVAGVMMLSFMPETWWSRMATIGQFETDTSASGRINAWWMAWNLARDHLMGGGFMVSKPPLFALYAPNPQDIHAAHSIYFMVLGEHGFPGLFLFLLMWVFVWQSAGRLRRQALWQPQTRWLSDLGAMCQVSLAGYAVGGAFLSLSYYDLPYNILLLVVLGCRWMDTRAWEQEVQEVQDAAGVAGAGTSAAAAASAAPAYRRALPSTL